MIGTKRSFTFTTNGKPNLENKNLKSIELIEKSIIDYISEIDHENCLPNDEDSFFICDLGEIKNLLKSGIRVYLLFNLIMQLNVTQI